MSDIFFIIASICIVVITSLLSVLLLKLINSVDDVNIIVGKAKTTTENLSKAVTTVSSTFAVVSPFLGFARKFIKKRNR